MTPQQLANLQHALTKVPTQLLLDEITRRRELDPCALTTIALHFRLSKETLFDYSQKSHAFVKARICAMAVLAHTRHLTIAQLASFFERKQSVIYGWQEKHRLYLQTDPHYLHSYHHLTSTLTQNIPDH